MGVQKVDSARALIARGWGVSLVSRCLRVSRAQLHVILRRTDDWKDGRRSRHSDNTDVLLRIHHVIGELPTYGYRRVWALLRRQAELDGMPAINAKRVYRIMRQNALLLERKTAVPPSKRAHTGKVAVKESNQRWCSDGFEFRCDNGEKLRVTFALDCCDREALYWAVTTGGFDSETVQDVMPGAVERRFGNELPASPVEWLTDNGSCYRANETRQFARMLGLEPKNTELSASIPEDVAVVPQKAVLVQGTIRDNILYGTDDILPDDELFCILNSLGLIKEDCGEHFLAFLDRDINPLGSGLSGGEIQRLCIARALARKKKIIVLDEPTASIGEELAIKIITYIRQHCPTVIITTHNPRILELADHFFDGMSKSCVIAGEGRDQ